jgi:hypothetical protein
MSSQSFRVLSWGCGVHGPCKARVQNLFHSRISEGSPTATRHDRHCKAAMRGSFWSSGSATEKGPHSTAQATQHDRSLYLELSSQERPSVVGRNSRVGWYCCPGRRTSPGGVSPRAIASAPRILLHRVESSITGVEPEKTA